MFGPKHRVSGAKPGVTSAVEPDIFLYGGGGEILPIKRGIASLSEQFLFCVILYYYFLLSVSFFSLPRLAAGLLRDLPIIIILIFFLS